jgi:hypothetical protein
MPANVVFTRAPLPRFDDHPRVWREVSRRAGRAARAHMAHMPVERVEASASARAIAALMASPH